MKSTNYPLLLIIAPLLFFAACKKGDPGPQGNTGAIGATGVAGTNGTNGTNGAKGATGANGANGAAGATGTANVIYSGWFPAKNFRDTVSDGSKLKVADLLAPQLTDAILNNGTVMVYFNFSTSGVYTLPYTSMAGGKLNTLSYLPRVGHFIITRFTADNAGDIPISTALLYRYVIIPGGIGAAAIANHVNINDYESVRKYFKLTN